MVPQLSQLICILELLCKYVQFWVERWDRATPTQQSEPGMNVQGEALILKKQQINKTY